VVALALAKKASLQTFKYFFYECTGENQFIEIDGREVPIRFDSERSKHAALSSLRALKWNVVYPNSDGVIKLVGTFDASTHEFVLVHWYLPESSNGVSS